MLIAILLQERGKLQQPLLNMSAFLERHRDEYVDHLLRVTQTGNWLAWVTFFLRGVELQAVHSLRRSEQLLKIHARYREMARPERASTTLAALVDFLFKKPVLAIGDAADELNVTRRTANNAIQRLVEFGILEEITGYRRNRAFAARELIRAIEDPMEDDV
jgi:Fic family protein